MDTKESFEIIITSAGEKAYFELLDYVFEYYSISQANRIALELLEYPEVLKMQQFIGTIEKLLENRKAKYRYLVYRRTRQMTVKIIYYVDEYLQKVYITDFFPSEMFPGKVIERG